MKRHVKRKARILFSRHLVLPDLARTTQTPTQDEMERFLQDLAC
jgi:hypothetical protein